MPSSSLPRIKLKSGEKIELTPPDIELIQRLFAGFDRLLIEQEFTGGYTPACVFRVIPYRAGHRRATQVVKLGPLPIIVDEQKRHHDYVGDIIPLTAAQITGFVEHGNRGAIAYTFVGGRILGETLSLKDFYGQQPPDQILKVLKRLLVDTLGQDWYGQRRLDQGPSYFEEFYSTRFPADLLLAPDEISLTALPPDPAYLHFSAETSAWQIQNLKPGQAFQVGGLVVEQKSNRIDLVQPDGTLRLSLDPESDVSKFPPLQSGQPVWIRGQVTSTRQNVLENMVKAIFDDSPEGPLDPTAETITLAGKRYSNPLINYQSYFNQALPDNRSNISIIHGDLHMFNIIVDDRYNPWLIDFGRVQLGHTIFDFVELETHLRDVILGDISMAHASLIDFENRLICATVTSESVDAPSDPDLAKAFAIIQGIREFAAPYLIQHGDFKGEYFPALFLYTLGSLKYHQENRYQAARQAFVTATLLASYLEDQLDCTSDDLMVTDPSCYHHIYYLKRASGDSDKQQAVRERAFIGQVQQAVKALYQWLGLAPPAKDFSWQEETKGDRHDMVLRYDSGRLQNEAGNRLGWLFVHELNDTYLLRLIASQVGKDQPFNSLVELCQEFPWHPDSGRVEVLGQSFFYTGLSRAPALELAQAVFEDSSTLWHTSLTCGELYTPPSLEAPNLLIFANVDQERLADSFFSQMALELGWYIHKGLRQNQEYKDQLYASAGAMEQDISDLLAKVQTLQSRLKEGSKDFDTLAAFHEQLHDLETKVLEYDNLLTTTDDVLQAIEINVQNHRHLTERCKFLVNADQDEIFKEQRYFLERLPLQIKTDLGFWQRKLEQARRTLELLRPVAQRFPLVDRDPTQLAKAILEYIRGQRPIMPHFEVDITIMFDDLKDSTAYISQHGDRQWLKLIRQHNDLLQPIVSRHQGGVVKNIGDGSLTIFTNATEAVQAAIEFQQSLKLHNQTANPTNQLQVRIGLHTGRALFDATDILGLAVSLASRICGKADAGEIVISETTYQAAGDVALDFENLGGQELKGVPEPLMLYRKAHKE